MRREQLRVFAASVLLGIGIYLLVFTLNFPPWMGMMQFAVLDAYSPWSGGTANLLGIAGLYLCTGAVLGIALGRNATAQSRPWRTSAEAWVVLQVLAWCACGLLVWRGYVAFE